MGLIWKRKGIISIINTFNTFPQWGHTNGPIHKRYIMSDQHMYLQHSKAVTASTNIYKNIAELITKKDPKNKMK